MTRRFLLLTLCLTRDSKGQGQVAGATVTANM